MNSQVTYEVTLLRKSNRRKIVSWSCCWGGKGGRYLNCDYSKMLLLAHIYESETSCVTWVREIKYIPVFSIVQTELFVHMLNKLLV